MDDFCTKCGACCNYIKADFEAKTLYWDGITALTDDFASMLIPKSDKKGIYFCKYLKNNLCTNENKPETCTNYPSSPFAELPQDCGYIGKVFMQNEKIKQKIRRLKEEIIHYEALCKISNNKKEQTQLQKIISAHQKIIDKYRQYGSNM